MIYTNMHTHTDFSDGADTVEANVRRAIELGMPSLGISDHCYTYFDTSYCVQADRLPEYKAEVKRIKELYRGQIDVYLGIELDGFARLPDRADYDYIIGDAHYVETPDGYRAVDLDKNDFRDISRTYFGGDTVAMAVSYYRSYAETVCPMKPDILGHIDLITKYSLVDESDSRYVKAATEALEAALAVTPVIELNTGAISRGYRCDPYPAVFILDEIKRLGGRILLSSDSHAAKDLTCWFDRAEELLLSRGIKSAVIYKNGKFEEVGIV